MRGLAGLTGWVSRPGAPLNRRNAGRDQVQKPIPRREFISSVVVVCGDVADFVEGHIVIVVFVFV